MRGPVYFIVCSTEFVVCRKLKTTNLKLKKGRCIKWFLLNATAFFYNNVFTASAIFLAMYGLFMV